MNEHGRTGGPDDPGATGGGDPPITPLRILVVDDEPAMVGAISALVGSAGHRVVTAYDGEAALVRFEAETPDLVLLDLAMPGLDGVEVVRRIRATSRVPIIVLTGETDELAKVEALDAGADDYVTKPFGRQELLARIRAAIRRGEGTAGATGPAALRVARCSVRMPVGYCTGISQPPKSTSRAPSATWRPWKGVRSRPADSGEVAFMPPPSLSAGRGPHG